MQILSDQGTISFSACSKETAGKESMCCFDIQHSSIKQLLRGVNQQKKKNPQQVRMKLRLSEPGEENSAQSSKQKALREERLSREELEVRVRTAE